ncbi:formate dehydrogenase family accessory protein FdhD [Methanocella sp. CWC-04]|uniref:Sulfur carrier protein FdhD n=2 Tax=Methanooceanicella nereidis TaxID=2052831 RepID=A0AAP2RBB7_9EURY|nr:formate dehydrogenase family accessory protein FdhD [Methanocella sp. CWC-04]
MENGSINGIHERGNENKDLTNSYTVTRVDRDAVTRVDVEVCVEESVNIILNGARVASLTITPSNLKEFVYGYLICEGLIRSIDRIESVEINWPDIFVKVPEFDKDDPGLWMEIRSSGCVGVRSSWMSLEGPVKSDISLSKDMIFHSIELINDLAVLWKTTGGTHCTIIFDKMGSLISYAEDMGRHNTIDKAVGKALLDGRDLSGCFMVCTGRMPAGMVAKAYRAGIPVIISNTAPFTTGIELARKLNMTLICFARPPRMQIYSVPERIKDIGTIRENVP